MTDKSRRRGRRLQDVVTDADVIPIGHVREQLAIRADELKAALENGTRAQQVEVSVTMMTLLQRYLAERLDTDLRHDKVIG